MTETYSEFKKSFTNKLKMLGYDIYTMCINHDNNIFHLSVMDKIHDIIYGLNEDYDISNSLTDLVVICEDYTPEFNNIIIQIKNLIRSYKEHRDILAYQQLVSAILDNINGLESDLKYIINISSKDDRDKSATNMINTLQELVIYLEKIIKLNA